MPKRIFNSWLLEMQQRCRERHKDDIAEQPVVVMPVEKTEPEKQKEKMEVAKALAIMKEAGIEFVKPDKYTRKKKIVEVKKEEPKVVEPAQPEKKQPVKSIFDTPQEPPVDFRSMNQHTGRAIFNPGDRVAAKKPFKDEPRVPIPEKTVVPFRRPPAVYDNQNKSLYGIDYNDL